MLNAHHAHCHLQCANARLAAGLSLVTSDIFVVAPKVDRADMVGALLNV